MIKKIIALIWLLLASTISQADYFYTYTNPLPLIKTQGDPYDLFTENLYGGFTFATNLQLAPSATYNIGTTYSGTFDTIFTRYVGFNFSESQNLNGTLVPARYFTGFVTTDENAQIIHWSVFADIPEPIGYSTSSATGDAAVYFGSTDFVIWKNAGGGTWSVTVQAIPEPSSSIIFLSGLITLGLIKRYRTKNL